MNDMLSYDLLEYGGQGSGHSALQQLGGPTGSIRSEMAMGRDEAKAAGIRAWSLQLKRGIVPVPRQEGTLLTHGQRSQRALAIAVGELVLNRVATSRIQSVADKMCGSHMTTRMIRYTRQRLDAKLEPWRMRPLGNIQALYLGSMTEQVQNADELEPCSILWAVGIQGDGRRRILGASAMCGRAETHWELFLRSLKDRGLFGLRILISEAHEGVQAASRTVWPMVPWQRCQTDIRRAAQQQSGGAISPAQLDVHLRSVFEASSRMEADQQLGEMDKQVRSGNPDLADWLSATLPQGLAVLDLPPPVPGRLRTSYIAAKLRAGIRRHTRVSPFYPSEAALLRMATTVLIEADKHWEEGQFYLKLNEPGHATGGRSRHGGKRTARRH